MAVPRLPRARWEKSGGGYLSRGRLGDMEGTDRDLGAHYGFPSIRGRPP